MQSAYHPFNQINTSLLFMLFKLKENESMKKNIKSWWCVHGIDASRKELVEVVSRCLKFRKHDSTQWFESTKCIRLDGRDKHEHLWHSPLKCCSDSSQTEVYITLHNSAYQENARNHGSFYIKCMFSDARIRKMLETIVASISNACSPMLGIIVASRSNACPLKPSRQGPCVS